MARAKADAGGGMSKMKMVTQALQDVRDGSPKDLQAYIKEKFGTDIATGMISSYKSNILRKQGGGRGGRGSGGDAQVGVRDLTAIQELIGRYGAAGLTNLVKVLSRK
jgi:hypothetical protein